ncbi:MAG: hypothetical protein JO283_05280 [Bradyrhizobium sp.]|nr:hypothetical protein [Bradyrhizobium sp.]
MSAKLRNASFRTHAYLPLSKAFENQSALDNAHGRIKKRIANPEAADVPKSGATRQVRREAEED